MNFGHYSCLTINDVKTLSSKSSLWGNFSGSVKLHIKKLKSINSIRGVRYYGPSKMSLLKLLIHSFSIIAVFKKVVFLRSVFLILISSYFVQKINLLVKEQDYKEFAEALSVSISIGVVNADTSHDIEYLMRCADEALFKVKNSGRDGISVHAFVS